HAGAARAMGVSILIGVGSACVAIVAGRVVGSGPMEAFGWGVLNIELALVVMTLLILPHELAHMVVARLLGMRVYRIRIGSCRRLWRSRVGDIDVQVWSVPWSGGLTFYAPLTRRAVRVRRAAVAIAGPLFHAVLLVPVVIFGIGDP